MHDWFFARALDLVRPGGIVAFVTSKGTLDKKNPAARRRIAERAELVGAVRLPNTAFSPHAEVTADVVILQKSPATPSPQTRTCATGPTPNLAAPSTSAWVPSCTGRIPRRRPLSESGE